MFCFFWCVLFCLIFLYRIVGWTFVPTWILLLTQLMLVRLFRDAIGTLLFADYGDCLKLLYSFFRTMGLRHLIVLDGDHRVTGIITRQDITEHRLEHHWFHEGDNMQKFINVDPMEPGTVYENTGLLSEELTGDGTGSGDGDYLPPQVGAFEMTRPPEAASSAASSGTTFSPMMMPAMSAGDVQQSVPPPVAGPPSRNKDRATKEPKSMKPK